MLVDVITCSFYVFPINMLFSSLRQIDYVCSPFFFPGQHRAKYADSFNASPLLLNT